MSDAPLRLAVFDCDGTLVDSAGVIVAAMNAAWAAEGLPAPEEALVRRQVGLPLVQAIANIAHAHAAELHHRLADHYRDAFLGGTMLDRHEEPLFPGCRAALEALAGDDVILAVATGKGRRGLQQTLERHNLSPYFTVLKTADDGPGKPAPDILLDAMAEVGAEPWNTVVIGDTIFDMAMAANARAKAVGVGWGYHPPHELTKAGAHALAERFEQVPVLAQTLWEGPA
ncbi:MAG: HAD-IA family hydrolase [Marivibrio sp.]|uniref:HAD-IA family hydrolase n=1 Tax=Marivibrio sp. TaxID=2039719 RepID=UPI0032EC7BFB